MASSEENLQSNLDVTLFGLSLDPAARRSLQAQLIDALRTLIRETPRVSGARLPASRKLAAELSVSRTTVQIAYEQLVSEGYLETRAGSGTFVAADLPHLSPPPEAAPHSAQTPEAWRPFHPGVPDQTLFPHRVWARHLEQAWRSPDPGLLARPDPFGWLALRRAIAAHLGAWRGLDCRPEQIVITAGASDALDIAFRAFLPPGPLLAIEDPGWPPLLTLLAGCGIISRHVAVDDNGLDAALVPDRAAAVIVTPSRHYPTGVTMPLARRMAVLDWAERAGGLIFEDDYDSEFRYKGTPLPSLAGLDGLRNTIYIGSFSKLLSSALRLGYMVLPERLVDSARAYLSRVGARTSLTPQPALAAFMDSGDFARHLRRMRRVYAKRQRLLLSQLEPLSDLIVVEPDPSGMHLCCPLQPALARITSDREIAQRAAARGLALRALSSHSVSRDTSQGLLLGFGATDETALVAAVDTLSDILRGLVDPR